MVRSIAPVQHHASCTVCLSLPPLPPWKDVGVARDESSQLQKALTHMSDEVTRAERAVGKKESDLAATQRQLEWVLFFYWCVWYGVLIVFGSLCWSLTLMGCVWFKVGYSDVYSEYIFGRVSCVGWCIRIFMAIYYCTGLQWVFFYYVRHGNRWYAWVFLAFCSVICSVRVAITQLCIMVQNLDTLNASHSPWWYSSWLRSYCRGKP